MAVVVQYLLEKVHCYPRSDVKDFAMLPAQRFKRETVLLLVVM